MPIVPDGVECTTMFKSPSLTAPRGQQLILEDAGHQRPSCLVLYRTTAGGSRDAYWLWVDSAGRLRIHTASPTDQDTQGTVVGTQT